MAWSFLPQVTHCCGCVTDLRAASAIIAVLGVVTSPAVSWAVVRHSYVVRVSCIITTHMSRPDLMDFKINNMLSFGFGANAGLGPSCMSPAENHTTINPTLILRNQPPAGSGFVGTVKWVGWVVLCADFMFLACSFDLLYNLFRTGPDIGVIRSANRFIWTCIIAILLSFTYSMLYVATCIIVGGSFPVFEFLFALIDVLVWSMWIYFYIVVRSFVLQVRKVQRDIELERLRASWSVWFNSILERLRLAMNHIYENYVITRPEPMLRDFDTIQYNFYGNEEYNNRDTNSIGLTRSYQERA